MLMTMRFSAWIRHHSLSCHKTSRSWRVAGSQSWCPEQQATGRSKVRPEWIHESIRLGIGTENKPQEIYEKYNRFRFLAIPRMYILISTTSNSKADVAALFQFTLALSAIWTVPLPMIWLERQARLLPSRLTTIQFQYLGCNSHNENVACLFTGPISRHFALVPFRRACRSELLVRRYWNKVLRAPWSQRCLCISTLYSFWSLNPTRWKRIVNVDFCCI